ncbi:NAD(P)H nitroreductase [Neiella marina]|uniref:Putative NAD(P)H nitroreductase n=1 Tax=Neiella holothuriorum TaxID=2870530 RepID=A0ABS7EGU4_9GAMM|nr:NAD(P)H nitroreductase [Neiella holothuriorum]MBW8191566.1 NAD(P)H nitroreductase [Neiella holothuriorum]
MDAIDLLLNRHSHGRLDLPGPNNDELDLILKAGLRAPDHAHLRPWRFVIYQGNGRQQLADLFERAAINNPELDEQAIAKAPTLPFRAPLVITVISKVLPHPKVPALEQHLSAGCSVMAMQQAALVLGYGGIWRSGVYATDPQVRSAFELGDSDEIVGFLYIGTAVGESRVRPMPQLDQYAEFIGE